MNHSRFSVYSVLLLLFHFFSTYSFVRSGGYYSPSGLLFYGITCLSGIFLLILLPRLQQGAVSETKGLWFLFALVLLNLYYQFVTFRLIYPDDKGGFILVAQWLPWLPFFGLASGLFFWKKAPAWSLFGAALLLAAAMLFPLSKIVSISPKPFIDVWYIYQEASAAVLQGRNPYTIEYSNLYPGSPWYPEGKADMYAYPPLTIVLNLIGFFLGDVRWGLLGFHLAGCGLILATGLRGGLAAMESFWIATLALSVPFIHFSIEQSWNEPYIFFGIALLAFFWRERWQIPVLLAFGFAVSLKQYMIIFFFYFLSFWRPWSLKNLFLAGIFPVTTYGFFFLLDHRALLHDIVTHFSQTPFRAEALSILSWLHKFWGVQFDSPPNLPSLVTLTAVILVGSVASYRSEPRDTARSMSYLLTLFATGFLAFVLTGKQAFPNYFYLVDIVVILAVLMSRLGDLESPEPQSHSNESP